MKPRGCVSSYQNSLSLENTTDAGRSSTSLDGMHTICSEPLHVVFITNCIRHLLNIARVVFFLADNLRGFNIIEHIERIQGIGVFVSTQSSSEILIQMVNINRGTHWEGIIIEDNLSFG